MPTRSGRKKQSLSEYLAEGQQEQADRQAQLPALEALERENAPERRQLRQKLKQLAEKAKNGHDISAEKSQVFERLKDLEPAKRIKK